MSAGIINEHECMHSKGLRMRGKLTDSQKGNRKQNDNKYHKDNTDLFSDNKKELVVSHKFQSCFFFEEHG